MELFDSGTYEDKELKCICGKRFIWTTGEQEFMNSLLDQGKISTIVEPKRCLDCRLKKKQQREARGEN